MKIFNTRVDSHKTLLLYAFAIHITCVVLLPLRGWTQNTETVLHEIENNNTTLKAYQNLNEAQKLENKTGIYLENPELGFNYLWGDPSSSGERTDFSIIQAFDFPTAYGIKKKIAAAKSEQSDLEFELQRKSILYQAKNICTELIYLNALHEILMERINHAEEIASAFNKKFEQGEVSILDKNKAQFNLLNARKELETMEIERAMHISMLTSFNGGDSVSFDQNIFPAIRLPKDFASWYKNYETKNLVVQQANNEVGISEKQIKLSKAMSLPKFSGGYMSEAVADESFRGITFGMSIPLGEHRNKVKLASAQQKVAVELAHDKKLKSYNQLQGQYQKALRLQHTLGSYREVLQSINSTSLLKKALDGGELTLIEYITEISMYYETTDKFLSIEKELNQLANGLYFFEL